MNQQTANILVLRRLISSFVLNQLMPEQNGQHFVGDIYKSMFLKKMLVFLAKLLLTYVPMGPIDRLSTDWISAKKAPSPFVKRWCSRRTPQWANFDLVEMIAPDPFFYKVFAGCIQSAQYPIDSLPFHFTSIRPTIPEIQLFRNLTLKYQMPRSWVMSKIKVTYYAEYPTNVLPFCFTSIGPTITDIWPK